MKTILATENIKIPEGGKMTESATMDVELYNGSNERLINFLF